MRVEILKYNDVWLDNGAITFYELLKEFEEEEIFSHLEINDDKIIYEYDDEEEFKYHLIEAIKRNREKLILMTEDEKTKVKKEIKKDHILIQEGSKINGKVALKETIYQPDKIKETIDEIFTSLNQGNRRCCFCNNTFKTSVKKLQQASYPFVTKIKSLSGIRTGINNDMPEYITDYCPQCYLNGIVEWFDQAMVYRNIPTQKSIIVLPNNESLKRNYLLKKQYKSILNNSQRWSNIKIEYDKENGETEGSYINNKFTAFISFYENFLRKVEPEFDNDNWYIIEIPAGSVKNPKYFNIVLDKNISRILKVLIREDYQYFFRGFIKEFYAFYIDQKKGIRDFDREKELHTILCEAVIKNDFGLFASAFKPTKGSNVGISKNAYNILENLLIKWRIEQMNIEDKEQYLKEIGSAATSLSNLIGTRTNLFFSLEKAKKIQDFLEVIATITRRNQIDDEKSVGTVYKGAIEAVVERIIKKENDTDGKEFFNNTKNLLLIYTSLRRNKDRQNNEKQQNSENQNG